MYEVNFVVITNAVQKDTNQQFLRTNIGSLRIAQAVLATFQTCGYTQDKSNLPGGCTHLKSCIAVSEVAIPKAAESQVTCFKITLKVHPMIAEMTCPPAFKALLRDHGYYHRNAFTRGWLGMKLPP